jgi:hypothetical protein
MSRQVNLRAAVRDGIISPDQAARIEGVKVLRPRWWARALAWLFVTLAGSAVALGLLALIVFSVRVIVG